MWRLNCDDYVLILLSRSATLIISFLLCLFLSPKWQQLQVFVSNVRVVGIRWVEEDLPFPIFNVSNALVKISL